jgi:hypothetical protein
MKFLMAIILMNTCMLAHAKDKTVSSRKPAQSGDYYCYYKLSYLSKVADEMSNTCERSKPFQIIKEDSFSYSFCCVSK